MEQCTKCGMEALQGMLIRDSVDAALLYCAKCRPKEKKVRKPRKRKEKPVLAAAAAVTDTIIQRVPKQEIPPVDHEVLRKDAQAWAQECGLGQVRLDGPDRENFPQHGYGYIFLVNEISGKQRRATARYTSRGMRSFWMIDGMLTG